MGRPARIRETYTSDVTRLSRLKESIERDMKRGKTWQDKVSNLLTELIFELTKAPKSTPK